MSEGRRRSLPLWREEVSVGAAQERWVARRQFTRLLMLTSLGMLTGNVWILTRARCSATASPPAARMIARFDALAPGEAMVFSYPDEGADCLLVRTASGQLVAYSQQCTHLSCAVVYSREHDRLECPCHDGAFSVHTGAVLYGPPPRPLRRVLLEQRGDEVWAIGFPPIGEEA
jgi:nitrite reductase/ring-hydroxylating ferredoxin subunit